MDMRGLQVLSRCKMVRVASEDKVSSATPKSSRGVGTNDFTRHDGRLSGSQRSCEETQLLAPKWLRTNLSRPTSLEQTSFPHPHL